MTQHLLLVPGSNCHELMVTNEMTVAQVPVGLIVSFTLALNTLFLWSYFPLICLALAYTLLELKAEPHGLELPRSADLR